MQPDQLLDRLVAADVLEAGADGDELGLTERFRQTRTDQLRRVETMDTTAVDGALRAVAGDDHQFPADDSARRALLATYRALDELTALDSAEERLRVLPAVHQFVETPSRTEGTPEPFTSVAGSQLPALLQSSARAVVYVWRDDCEPCDYLRAELADCFAEPPGDVALFSVYGPNSLDVMNEYDVVGAPTLLFVANGRVDARLFGAQHAATVTAEVEKLRDIAPSQAE